MENISELFRAFAKRECSGSSYLYEFLSMHIADDVELLELAAEARQGQPIPNLFFGAVQYLLFKGKNHKLREYYRSIVSNPKEINTAFFHFKDFCLQHKTEMITLLKNKLVQTNEVRRCAYLYPSFCYIYEKVKRPLALIEIGTSAGLQLHWDQYAYSYNSGEIFGNSNSELRIISEIRGNKTPVLYKNSPPVTHKFGVDIHVNDLKNSEDVLWLKSLIWPEHEERMKYFDKAADNFRKHPLELIEGDGVKLLPEAASKIPQDSVICIFHTHVANQIPMDAKYELIQLIQSLGTTRDVFHLYNNMWDSDLHLDYFIHGKEHNETLAVTDPHGQWFRWEL